MTDEIPGERSDAFLFDEPLDKDQKIMAVRVEKSVETTEDHGWVLKPLATVVGAAATIRKMLPYAAAVGGAVWAAINGFIPGIGP